MKDVQANKDRKAPENKKNKKQEKEEVVIEDKKTEKEDYAATQKTTVASTAKPTIKNRSKKENAAYATSILVCFYMHHGSNPTYTRSYFVTMQSSNWVVIIYLRVSDKPTGKQGAKKGKESGSSMDDSKSPLQKDPGEQESKSSILWQI